MRRHKINVTPEQLRNLVAQGIISPDAAKVLPVKRGKYKLVAESFTPPVAPAVSPVLFVVAAYTASEMNQRVSTQKDRSANQARKRVIRKAISQALGKQLEYLIPFAKAFHSGHTVRVHFCRLGGQGLDRMANLGPSMKAAEDAVALMIGADDGASNWLATCDQKPGGDYGILIVLSLDT